jgi:hypothetical protein
MDKQRKGFLIILIIAFIVIGGVAGIVLFSNPAEPETITFTVNVDCNVEWYGLVQIDGDEANRIEISGFSDKEFTYTCHESLIVVVSKVSDMTGWLNAVIWRGDRIISQDSVLMGQDKTISLTATKWD